MGRVEGMPDRTPATEAIALLGRTPYGRVSASQRALPFTTVTRHLVTDGVLTLRLHRGFGYHRALDGNVVAYEADNLGSGAGDAWCVQCTGTARLTEPSRDERSRFGRTPELADGEPFDPVFLHVTPALVTVHILTGLAALTDAYPV